MQARLWEVVKCTWMLAYYTYHSGICLSLTICFWYLVKMQMEFTNFNWCVLFNCMNLSVHLFPFWWIFMVFPIFHYYKYPMTILGRVHGGEEHICKSFFRVFTWRWNCWIIEYALFQLCFICPILQRIITNLKSHQ